MLGWGARCFSQVCAAAVTVVRQLLSASSITHLHCDTGADSIMWCDGQIMLLSAPVLMTALKRAPFPWLSLCLLQLAPTAQASPLPTRAWLSTSQAPSASLSRCCR
jgi:hypothetical protein